MHLLEQIENTRRELLDISLSHNRFLSCRRSAKSLKTLEFENGCSTRVYDRLVDEGKSIGFVPTVEESEAEETRDEVLFDTSVDFEEPSPCSEPDRREDSLYAPVTASRLDRQLLALHRDTKALQEEQGIDTLYLALGFLYWKDAKDSDTLRRAPLVLVPLEMSRTSAGADFRASYSESDLEPNLPLEMKLKSDFGILLPKWPEELDVPAYYQDIRDAIARQDGWSVAEDEMAMGLFSFGKIQMYRDLDPEHWSHLDTEQGHHPVIDGLFGKGFGPELDGRERSDGEDHIPPPNPTSMELVKDADSSQTRAVQEAMKQVALVIQGPPGTGKSQTITNIIAEAVACEQTVLFVSEKMAALEVVKRRLDESKLGDCVLELHSHKSNKKEVLRELDRTLQLGRPRVRSAEQDIQKLQTLQQKLDEYAATANTPLFDLGKSYVHLVGLYLKNQRKCGERKPFKLPFEPMKSWKWEDYLTARQHVQALMDHLKQMGTPRRSPFSSLCRESMSPIEKGEIEEHLCETQKVLSEIRSLCETMAKTTDHDPPIMMSGVQPLCECAETYDASLSSRPCEKASLDLTSSRWLEEAEDIGALLSSGQQGEIIHQAHESNLMDSAWQEDWKEDRGVLATTGQSWWRFLSGRYRRANARLIGQLNEPRKLSPKEKLSIVDDILRTQAIEKDLAENESLLSELFGRAWQGQGSDWNALSQVNQWVQESHAKIAENKLPSTFFQSVLSGQATEVGQDSIDRLRDHSKRFAILWKELLTHLNIHQADTIQDCVELELLQARLDQWVSHWGEVENMIRFRRLATNVTEAGLPDLSAIAYSLDTTETSPEMLVMSLDRCWLKGTLSKVYTEYPLLAEFNRTDHENLVEEFRQLDRERLEHAQNMIAKHHYERMPHRQAPGEMTTLRTEMAKKRRHKPIRRLLRETGRTIQEIKPIFMMSPMSVATYLAQDSVKFDLVVFDEASQVRVPDSLGAILRGKRTVVVGDTQQMPPTNFFSRTAELDAEEAEQSQSADIESVLGMFIKQGAPESLLQWHYRSRHESLIAVSNREFYDNRLMIFPTPSVHSDATGLRLNLLQDTQYIPGRANNPAEAQHVAKQVMEHARTSPHLTLGVVAFSTSQRDAILDELELLRRSDPSCEHFFRESARNNRLESFFVKNLENVQGDERDVIYISVGYGRDAEGRLLQRFGPINQNGGHRRLNVLITRARMKMDVFCNFQADDMRVTPSSARGVRALQAFLRYAQTRELTSTVGSGREPDSPFEVDVIHAIQNMGYEVEPQVGTCGFFIDIAVRDPEKPGRFVLAVECDGASYHSSATARDRDRIRQAVLEDLGWRFHRIWSTDWFNNRATEIDRLKESIVTAIGYLEQQDKTAAFPPLFDPPTDESEDEGIEIERAEESHRVSPYVTAVYQRVSGDSLQIRLGTEAHEIPPVALALAIKRIVEVESPIHEEEIMRRIIEVTGQRRIGQRIKSHIQRAIHTATRRKYVVREKPFLFDPNQTEVNVRHRNDDSLPEASRTMEYVAPAEIHAAIRQVLDASHRVPQDELVRRIASMFGFNRLTDNVKKPIEQVLASVMQSGDQSPAGWE